MALVGPSGAGKSTLFNCLIETHRAIVSPIAGTTRDYLTATLRLDSMEMELIDTAGWEDAADLIMEQAQELRTEQISASDLVVWCTAADLSPEACDEDARLQRLALLRCPSILKVLTRCDLVSDESQFLDDVSSLRISAASGRGIELLRSALRQRLFGAQSARSELLGTTAGRCRDSLQRTIQSLEHAKSAATERRGDELIAIEIRQALLELSAILGEVYTDDILDHIFSNFCIGK